MRNAGYWMDKLHLEPHPEGGFFRQTYQADLALPQASLPSVFKGDRRVSTAIYFLLQDEDFSAFHRLASDEMWHFYAGDSLEVHIIEEYGQHSVIAIGEDADHGEQFQAVVPAGCWFASCLARPHGFALVGCTVAPGFDFADFEMANRAALVADYPQHRGLIERLTRPDQLAAAPRIKAGLLHTRSGQSMPDHSKADDCEMA